MTPSLFDYFAHGGLLVAYFAIMMYAADTARHLKKARNPCIRRLLSSFVLVTAVLSGTFAVIQGGWVLFDGFSAWPEPLDWAWLIFDSANAIAYAAFLGAIRVYLLWKPDFCARCKNREKCPHVATEGVDYG